MAWLLAYVAAGVAWNVIRSALALVAMRRYPELRSAVSGQTPGTWVANVALWPADVLYLGVGTAKGLIAIWSARRTDQRLRRGA